MRSRRRLAAECFTLAAALVTAIVWPGDVAWFNDEAELIAHAWFGNHYHMLVHRGLPGNFTICYGPLPTHIYQLLLLITHDPLHLVMLRAALCAGVTTLSMLWLARSLGLSPWFAAAIILAPYIWLFNRLMWDASFAIPLGMVTLAAYASFLQTRARRWLLLAGAGALCLPLIHPQDLPLTAAILGHMLWRERRAVWQHRIGVLLVIAAVIALNAYYFLDVAGTLADRLAGQIQSGYPGSTSRIPSLLAPLLAGRLFAGDIFADYDAQLHAAGPLFYLLAAARLGSLLIFPLLWSGIAISVWRAVRHRGDPPQTVSLRDTTGGIAVVALVLQSFLYGLMRVPPAPQYFFGLFAVDVLLAWLTIDALRRFRLDWPVVALYGLCCAGITLAAMCQTHRFGYARNTHRPTLSNQIAIARELNRYSDTAALTNVVPYYELGPNANLLRCLRLFYPHDPTQPQTRSGRLVIRYVLGPTGKDSRIELIQADVPGGIPPDAQPIDVTPRAAP